MKKKSLFFSLLCSVVVNAQIMSTYNPQSYDDYGNAFRMYAQAFEKAEAQINDLTDVVVDALAGNIDEVAKRDFNSDYDRLLSLSENLHKNGLSQGIWSGINSVRTSINNHIVSYNERVRIQEAQEKARRQEEARARQKEKEEAEEAKRKAGWSGSGFALAQGHIVTNYHVIENAKTILVKGIKGDFVTEYRASVVATDKINDIAIIKISDDRFKGFGTIPYKIKRGMSDVGESVWALGYPMVGVMGDEVKFTDGKISARTGIQGDMSVYQISVPIQPGNSGGPLFDNNGNIVGITSSGLNREAFNSENVNYAIKTSYLYNLVESSLSSSVMPQGNAMQGQALTEKIKLAKKFVFIIECSDESDSYTAEEGRGDEVQTQRIVTKEGDVHIKYPKFYQTKGLEVNEIILNSKHTILHLVWNNIESGQTWLNVSPDAYISVYNDTPKGKKYKLLDAQLIKIAPESEDVPKNFRTEFFLYFEPISKTSYQIIFRDPREVGGLPSIWGIWLN